MNSNAFSAADMTTAAASGHRDGYQAGYADAVKAVEVGKPAAAQEAVAWRDDVGNLYPDKESVDKYLPRGRTVHALYAAPVAAAPVDDGMLPDALVPYYKEWYTLCERRFAVDRIKISGDLACAIVDAICQRPARTPAAPGIDLTTAEVGVIEALLALAYAAWNAADNGEDNGESLTIERSEFAAVGKALDTLDALPDDRPGYVMEAAAKARWALRRVLSAPLIDTSPKGVTMHNDGSSEAQFIADAERLNCTVCGGSGHVDDTPKGGSNVVSEYIAARDAYEEAVKPSGGFGQPKRLCHSDPIILRYRNARTALNALQATSAEDGSEHFQDRLAEIEGRPRPEPEVDEVEVVAACLGDDAAAMLDENPEDERALNMQRAAELLTELQATSAEVGS